MHLPAIIGAQGDVRAGELSVVRPVFDPEEVRGMVHGLSGAVHGVPQANHRIELSHVGAESSHFFASTSNAGLTTNTPNILDSALRAVVAEREGMGFAYTALPGNSLTRVGELAQYARTGSWLVRQGDALVAGPYVVSMLGALAREDIHPKVLLSTGHGGILQTALGASLPRGSVDRVVEVARPGVIDAMLTDILPAEIRDELEMPSNTHIDYGRDSDPYYFDSETGRAVLEGGLSPEFKEKRQHYIQSPPAVIAHWLASGHRASPATLRRDHEALLGQQPGARLTFVVPELDVKQRIDATNPPERLLKIVQGLSRLTSAQVEVVFVPGQSRNSLTRFPSLLAAFGNAGPAR